MDTKDVFLQALLADIENTKERIPAQKKHPQSIILGCDPHLKNHLSGWIGALIIRTLFNSLNIDEHHLFKWRLENKYIQYLVLTHYYPECMAETYSLSDLYNNYRGYQKVKEMVTEGFFLKATLGYGSGRNGTFDRSDILEKVLANEPEDFGYNEKWILQRFLVFRAEIRIHTFGSDLLQFLSFVTKGEDLSVISGAENFTNSVLQHLPQSILGGSLIAWDIGLTDQGIFKIVEANFTGFHPVYKAGFQTSGYFDDPNFGSINCALFNSYIFKKFNICIADVEHLLLTKYPILHELFFYASLINIQHMNALSNLNYRNVSHILFYITKPFIVDYMLKLYSFFMIKGIAERISIITNSRLYHQIYSTVGKNKGTSIKLEADLYTEEQYDLIRCLNFERKRASCAYRLIRRYPRHNYLIF
jgi:hypothetical protein